MYRGPRIDGDVHHSWQKDAEVLEYLPRKWREYAELRGKPTLSLNPPSLYAPAANGISYRMDAYPESGAPPGSDYDLMRTQLLEPFNTVRCVVSFDIGPHAGLANTEFAAEVVTACNRWSLEHWLGDRDERIYGSLMLPTQDPLRAAAEIRRFGGHPRFAEALLLINGTGKPYGDPVYHPIYEAAAEMDLPVGIHIAGDVFLPGLAQTTAGGIANTRFGRHTLHALPVQHYILSFLVHGVFEKFPSLRLLVKETGIAWLPWFMWEVDALRHEIRRETTWLKRDPSDYVRRHLRVTTQPFDESPEPEQLIELLELAGGIDDMMCFATDYPHHDTDDPDFVTRRLPERWWKKVFYQNALKVYGWKAEELPAITGGIPVAG